VRLFRALPALTKLPISVLSALSASAGYLAFARGTSAGVLPASLGVVLMAMGGCAANEWEERDIDARMERTRRRPIPSGLISPTEGLAAGLALALGGFAVLAGWSGPVPALLGLAAFILYVAIYTPLKRRSAFAWLPGALIGAIPPAIGWTAAGGSILDRGVLPLSFFFFLWQIPHFWLLLSVRGREYEGAGFPSLTRVFGPERLARLTFIWMVAAAGSSLLLPLFGVVSSRPAAFGLVAAAALTAILAPRLLRSPGDRETLRLAFRGINLHALFVIVVVSADALAA